MMRVLVLVVGAMLLAACGEGDPGAIGPSGVDGGLSPEGARQEYVDGVIGALAQLSQATQGPAYAKSVDTGNKQQLQVAALAWQQGGQQLKQLSPPKAAVKGHKALVAAVDSLNVWNQKVVAAAPNKKRTQQVATTAANSPASQNFGAAICMLVQAGYDVVDPGECGSPLDSASSPVG